MLVGWGWLAAAGFHAQGDQMRAGHALHASGGCEQGGACNGTMVAGQG